MELTLDTWLISDTHFFHANIVKYSGRPEDHERIMIRNWNESVSDKDTVLHLGDVAFLKKDHLSTLTALIGNLKGTKYLIRGNHDRSAAWYYDAGFSKVTNSHYQVFDIHGKKTQVFFSHYPRAKASGDQWQICIHGHIHNNGYDSRLPMDIDYRNISVEVMDYKPVRLRDVLFNGAYQSRVDAGDSSHPDRNVDKQIVLPDAFQTGYFGSHDQ